ncbi:fatty acid CoA ligase Acsl3 isoform X2 [Linepithema humile]|nr:PREDICTED: long-chain-fatty-acid--CoA ligase 4 isoform X2 [Linepithema humile]XP_012235089.1 PREDICTED: long-chain-fatty-acid--CoA ligase 4 isoform X2 [Linepithema humile]XP_012235090.1 PREDICTED: long-chain-fatty-acid--CoA ligase 4 isoform X2 [Linepithema humile]XP_012235091.1 PREDICTED: long-chain-fatty-acid--CoA ligase 4 isoform X2 [Linepithema humile]XP_012235092.1 PREDICTED: long-chain-fatty-acid--CoA ligase 4 isoform X2 [Linepithema humile]XP_012235093.1 PREDICTED: long-chain-fatty-ac
MENFWISGAIHAIKALSYVYDLLTFPVYLILQRPWEKRKASRRIKARPISKDESQVTYRSVDSPGLMHIMLEREKIDTLEKVLLWVVKMHGEKRCLGTRQILAEEDEPQPNGRVFKKYKMGEYKWKTFGDVDRLASSFGQGLLELGMRPRKNVVIFAETRAEWMIAAHACFKQNFTVVTIYATLGDEAIAHGINETEVDTVITSHDLLPKFKRLLDMVPEVRTVIYMEDQLKSTDTKGYKDGVRLIPFSDVIKTGIQSTASGTSPKSDDTAIIMYTSGSTGVPKGVLLSHKNIMSTLKAFCDAVTIRPDDVFLGFLPLAHVFELLAESVCLLNGVPIGYSSPLTLIDSSSKIQRGSKGDASVLHPTCLTAVPLILDRISKGINEKVKKSGLFRQAIFNFAYEYKLKWTKRGYETPLFDKYIFGAAKQVLGGRVRLVLSGGAPLSPDTHNQVKLCLCITVTQGYGLTETTSCATVMDAFDRTTGRVGAPTTVCDIRLENWEEAGYRVTDHPHPRGEILIGGDIVSAGYYKLSDKTKEDFFQEDGRQWFRTGDIGEFHPDGSIKIIDRKKDLVKLQLGEYVSLGKVESELKTCPVVENICVYGDANKAYTVALVVPNQHYLDEIADTLGITEKRSLEELCSNPEIEKAVLQELVEQAKKCKLQRFEIPGAVKLCAEQWSPDMGLVTAAFKLKRKAVQERYQHEINRMYAS